RRPRSGADRGAGDAARGRPAQGVPDRDEAEGEGGGARRGRQDTAVAARSEGRRGARGRRELPREGEREGGSGPEGVRDPGRPPQAAEAVTRAPRERFLRVNLR